MDERFDVALFRPSEVADYLWVRRSTLRDWLGTAVTQLPERDGFTIPFAGLVEARVIKQLRGAGLTFRSIRDANERLKTTLGRKHPLIYKHLAHDGRDVLHRMDENWVRARDDQRGIPGVIEQGLRTITEWAKDDYPQQLALDGFKGAKVIVDPRFAGGSPILENSGVRVADVLNLVRAGDSLNEVAEEFNLDKSEVESLILADYRRTKAA